MGSPLMLLILLV